MTSATTHAESAPASAVQSPWSRVHIAAGQFFFKYRNSLFPVLFALTALTMRPRRLFADPAFDRVWLIGSAAIALAGEFVRLTTIGFEYIERGGRNGQVWASRLVVGGIYAHSRNPMYVGNSLIAIGMALLTTSPLTWAVVIPLFLYIYVAIVAAEEQFLRGKFGREYDEYAARVPRYLPTLAGWSRLLAADYDWRRAVRQDLSTFTALFLGINGMLTLRTVFLEGVDAIPQIAPWSAAGFVVVLLLYGWLYRLKKQGRLVKPSSTWPRRAAA